MDDEIKYSEELDHALQATVGKLTHGISPAALTLAFLDWSIHLGFHPAKQLELLELARENYLRMLSSHPDQSCITSEKNDKRFSDKIWDEFPYRHLYESFLMSQ